MISGFGTCVSLVFLRACEVPQLKAQRCLEMTLSRHEPVKDAFEVSESAPARTAAPPIAARASRRERPAWLRRPMDSSTSCRSAGVIRIRRCLTREDADRSALQRLYPLP